MNNYEHNFKFYVDFDGTITTEDIGEEMFVQFGDAEKSYKIIKEWLDKKITSQEVWSKLCKTIDKFDKEKFDDFLNNSTVDDKFHGFLDYCKKHSFDVTILSDGLDYYIDKISKKEKFNHLKKYSNKLKITNDGKLLPEFPYTDEECKLCANCKRNHILTTSGDDDITIYIGNGWSDTCAAQHCDFIFAKRSLLKFCEKNSVPYFPFKTFDDVLKIVDKLRTKKKVKKRNQASLKRREAYMQG